MPEYEHINYLDASWIRTFLISIEQRLFHWHREIEFIYVLKGSVTINTATNQFILKKDQLLIVNSQEIHSLTKTEDENILLVIQADSSTNSFTKFYNQNESFIMKPYSVLANENSSVIYTLMIDIMLTSINKKNGHIYRQTGLLNELFYIVNTCLPKKKLEPNTMANKNGNLHKVHTILSYINDNFQDKIYLEDLANIINLNKAYMSHFFKKHVGVNFESYLRLVRLNYATELILDEEKSILEISLECGFSDYQYLNKAFKEEFGCTPSQYRKNKKEIMTKRKDIKTKEETRGQYIYKDHNQILKILEDYYLENSPNRTYIL